VLFISAHDPKSVASLRDVIIAFFDARMVEAEIVIPYARQALVGSVYEAARVLSEDYDDQGTRLRIRGLPEAIAKLHATFPR
jgi:GTP-binding protein HflX